VAEPGVIELDLSSLRGFRRQLPALVTPRPGSAQGPGQGPVAQWARVPSSLMADRETRLPFTPGTAELRSRLPALVRCVGARAPVLPCGFEVRFRFRRLRRRIRDRLPAASGSTQAVTYRGSAPTHYETGARAKESSHKEINLGRTGPTSEGTEHKITNRRQPQLEKKRPDPPGSQREHSSSSARHPRAPTRSAIGPAAGFCSRRSRTRSFRSLLPGRAPAQQSAFETCSRFRRLRRRIRDLSLSSCACGRGHVPREQRGPYEGRSAAVGASERIRIVVQRKEPT